MLFGDGGPLVALWKKIGSLFSCFYAGEQRRQDKIGILWRL